MERETLTGNASFDGSYALLLRLGAENNQLTMDALRDASVLCWTLAAAQTLGPPTVEDQIRAVDAFADFLRDTVRNGTTASLTGQLEEVVEEARRKWST